MDKDKGFYGVRLKEYNPRKGQNRLTYTSFHAGTKYTAGTGGMPSSFTIVRNEKEIEKLRTIKEFEIIEFKSREELDEYVRKEAEERARKRGTQPVRAEVIGETPKKSKRVDSDILSTVKPKGTSGKSDESKQHEGGLGDDEEEDLSKSVGEDAGARDGGRKPSSDLTPKGTSGPESKGDSEGDSGSESEGESGETEPSETAEEMEKVKKEEKEKAEAEAKEKAQAEVDEKAEKKAKEDAEKKAADDKKKKDAAAKKKKAADKKKAAAKKKAQKKKQNKKK